jgi:hypothetical protein
VRGALGKITITAIFDNLYICWSIFRLERYCQETAIDGKTELILYNLNLQVRERQLIKRQDKARIIVQDMFIVIK